MSADEEVLTQPKAGTYADLARRMDRMEQRHESLEGEVRALSATVARVESNQSHAAELNKLRFDALDSGLKVIVGKLDEDARRMEGVLTGETATFASRELEERRVAGEKAVSDYEKWHATVEDRLDDQAVMAGQIKVLARLVIFLTGGSLVGAIAAIIVIIQAIGAQ